MYKTESIENHGSTLRICSSLTCTGADFVRFLILCLFSACYHFSLPINHLLMAVNFTFSSFIDSITHYACNLAFSICGSLASTTIFKECFVKTSSGGQEHYIVRAQCRVSLSYVVLSHCVLNDCHLSVIVFMSKFVKMDC